MPNANNVIWIIVGILLLIALLFYVVPKFG